MRKNNNTLGFGLLAMIVVSFAIYIAFAQLIKNQRGYLNYVQSLYESGDALNMSASLSKEELSHFLEAKRYADTREDADAIAEHICETILSGGNGLRNLGSINFSKNRIPASYIDSAGGPGLKARAERSKEILGQNLNYCEAYRSMNMESTYCQSDSSRCTIVVTVKENKQAIHDVPVRLKRHYYYQSDSLIDGMSAIPCDTLIAFAITDEKGRATFNVEDGYYSVVPIQSGYEFGKSKGSTKGILKSGRHNYSFERKVHSIPVFSDEIYQAIRTENAMTVRTPQMYMGQIKVSLGAILLAWWAAFILIAFLGNAKRNRQDLLLLPIAMLLNSLGIIVLYGASNPLMDRPLGQEMFFASLLGILLMVIISRLPIAKFFASGVKAFGKQIPFEPIPGAIKGTTYLILSIALIVLLAFFGTAPEGSTAKVNLLFIQPSEVCKYLFVIFMASFFAENADSIRKFSETTNKVSLRFHVRTAAAIVVAILLIFMLYMWVVSDMGPALVLLVTFILMYSVARRDVGQLVLGIISFLLVEYAFARAWGTTVAVVTAPIVWLTLWILYGWLRKKTVYESAIFFNLLLILFVAGGPILRILGFTHQAARLESRMAMSGSGVWDNFNLQGGDQVAQAIWGYSAGGFKGMGLGLGNANLTPAYHTDLILSAVGEQMGLFPLLMIALCFAFFLYRALKDGQNAGNPFSFYLAAGIGLVTVIQFSIIALGSVGLIPLTGVAVPFMSYAKSSLVCNLAAVGLLLAVSRERAGVYQSAKMKEYRIALTTSFVTLGIVMLAFGVSLWGYMVSDRDATMIKTGVFADESGVRHHVYNPRITALIGKMHTETIYDRNGLVLATSDPQEIVVTQDSIRLAGIPESQIESAIIERTRRHYPFGMHTFFMVGDFNRKTQWNISVSNPYGFNAENRFLAVLRGFNNQRKSANGMSILENIRTRRYRPDRFLPALDCDFSSKTMNYDYSELLPLLKDGNNTRREVLSIKKDEARPVQLTIDAALQVRLQQRMEEYIQGNSLASIDKLRVSVVILESSTGDLLSSANYPLPKADILDSLETNGIFIYSDNYNTLPAYTDRDLGLTYQTHPGSTSKIMTALAAYMKLGAKAHDVVYNIDLTEIIENGKIKEPYSTVGGKYFRKGISMTEAIVRSSNCFFVNLMNDKNTYAEQGRIYRTVGVRLDGHEGRRNITPYFFYEDEFQSSVEFENEVNYVSANGRRIYQDYQEEKKSGHYHKLSRYHNSADYWGISYGQGQLYATPLNIARVGTIVANDGRFISTRFTMDAPYVKGEKLVDAGMPLLQQDMAQEADKHRFNGFAIPSGSMSKTGTPERSRFKYDDNGVLVEEKPNDGWYLCVIPSLEGNSYYSIVVRMERLGQSGSSMAVKFTSDVVVPVLRQCGYVSK